MSPKNEGSHRYWFQEAGFTMDNVSFRGWQWYLLSELFLCSGWKIDLEVSEPINFSSGDHQHLVQKAAIKSGHSKIDQPFTYSSRNTPQEAIKYPRSKQRDTANTYAVQISDDVISEETITSPPGPFESMSIRKGFILKVFVVLSVQLLVTATIIGVFVFSKPLRQWVISVPWFIYALLPACFIVIIVLACCRDVRRQVPMNYILLALFWDFTLLNGVLFVCLCVLFVYGIIALVIRSYWLHLVYAALGTLLFSMYLVMDVQMMVGGRYHYEVDPEEYIFAALNIYVDIISLFIFILDLIAR
ncbi:protein lifeguard 1-like isoform X4 [Peromyscus californicus insignis]|uniref:protein lifeguard 1-like isoform X4 n=1 Tax=Peromyscus californicus insignis TaxID=564181 RepID=UPI0022A73C60|nr:protein lifeguard 1-like isoform X4 [Peromyscus californicus insignis]